MADITAEGTVVTTNARAMRNIVFVSPLVGYWFFVDSDDDFFYLKTTDGGATWGSPVEIDTDTTITAVAFGVWYDRWTPGDNGTKIHIWWFTSDNNLVVYRSLDTNGDALGSQTTVLTGASSVAGRGAFVSGTKTRSGVLYVAYDIDAGTEKGFHKSTDSGGTWSASLSATFIEATLDEALLFPSSNADDNDDCWAVYLDASANALTLKVWDSSAGTASESATIQTHTQNGTDLTGQRGYSGTIRHSDGHLILTATSEFDTATGDHEVYDINGTGSIVKLTDICTNIDDHYYPVIFIDQFTNYLYCAYNGKKDGSETIGTTTKVYYVKSTDNGSTWSAEQTYMEGAAGVVVQVYAPIMGYRFYVGWRVGTTLIANAVSSIDLTPAASNLGYDRRRIVRSPIPFPTGGKRPVEPLPISETIVALTGVAATAAVGTLVAAATLALSGVQGTSAINIGAPTTSVGITGVQGTSAQGTMGFGPQLVGFQATGSLGTLGVTVSVPLTGVLGTGSVGTLAPSSSKALTGVGGTGSSGTLTPAFDVSLSGVQGTGSIGIIGAGGAGSAGLSGVQGTGSLGTLALSEDVALSGIAGTSGQGTLVPGVSLTLSGVQASGTIGNLGLTTNAIDRPRVVRGPFPFPKSTPAFPTTAGPVVTNVALTGVEATGDVGDIETPIFMTVGLTGVEATGLVGTIQAGTPGSAALTGVGGTGQPGTLTSNIAVALTGVEATGVIGTVVPARLTYDRPISVKGPFPFLPSSGLFSFKERFRHVIDPSTGQSFTASLTGVQAAGQIGSLTVVRDAPLTGTAGTGSVGTIAPSLAPALTGVTASGSVGSLGTAQALTGVQAAGQVGTETPNISIALIGVSALGSLGSLAAQANEDVTIGLTGVTATGTLGTLTPVHSQSLTSVIGTGSVGTAAPSDSIALTSVTGTSALGSLSASGSGQATLTGLQATGTLGTLTGVASRTLVGQTAQGQVGILTPVIAVALTGVEATGSVGTFSLDEGSILDLVGEYKTMLDFVGELE